MTPAEFRLAVKHRLIDLGKTQTWLISEYRARTGKWCDNSYLKRLYDGKIHPDEPIRVIKDILGITEE